MSERDRQTERERGGGEVSARGEMKCIYRIIDRSIYPRDTLWDKQIEPEADKWNTRHVV